MLKGVDHHMKHIINYKPKDFAELLNVSVKLFKDGKERKYLSLKERLRIDVIILTTNISNSKA